MASLGLDLTFRNRLDRRNRHVGQYLSKAYDANALMRTRLSFEVT